MSSSNTGKKASAKQVEVISTKAPDLFTGSASTVIAVMNDYKLLNSVGKACFENNAENKKAAAEALYAFIDTKAAKDAEWRAENPRTPQVPVPAT